MTRPVPTYRTAARASLNRRTRLVFGTRRDLPVAVHDRVGVPLRASCRRAVRSFRAGPCVRCRRGSPSRSLVGMRSAAGVDWLGGWRAGRGRRAARHGPQRGAAERRSSPSHRSRYSPARSRCIRTWTIRSAEVRIVVTSHGTLDRGRRRRGPAVAHRRGPPRHASTAGKPHPRSSTDWSPTAADRPPQVPRRHAARHNHRGSHHRPGYDQIQPPTAASTTRSRQETSVQPRNHGPGLRITQAYRGNSARVGVG